MWAKKIVLAIISGIKVFTNLDMIDLFCFPYDPKGNIFFDSLFWWEWRILLIVIQWFKESELYFSFLAFMIKCFKDFEDINSWYIEVNYFIKKVIN